MLMVYGLGMDVAFEVKINDELMVVLVPGHTIIDAGYMITDIDIKNVKLEEVGSDERGKTK